MSATKIKRDNAVNVSTDRCTSSHEIDDRPAMNHGGKVERVPIGEADAAVRFGLADFFRRRRAMYAVGWRREIDPHQADRILRPRLDGKFVLGLDALEGKARAPRPLL